MKKTMKNGVWPVMITPYTLDNKIDYPGVQKILEWYGSQGVAGVFSVCQSSEMFLLTREERVSLAKFVISNAPKGMDVIASGHVGESLDEQIEDAKMIIDAGVDSYVFISNQFAKENEHEDIAKKRIESLINKIPAESFGIYECPQPYKRLISPDLLRWCADTGRFSFLKDTCCNLDEIEAKIKAVEGSRLKIYNANGATLLDSLKLGAAGYSGVMANFHAKLYVWLCANYDKEPEKAAIVQDVLGFGSLVECQMYPVNSKYHMNLEGVDINLQSRVQDFTQFSESKKLEVEQMHRTIKMLQNEIFN